MHFRHLKAIKCYFEQGQKAEGEAYFPLLLAIALYLIEWNIWNDFLQSLKYSY